MFVDTSGFLCYLNRHEPRFQSASGLLASARVRVTHSYVLAELVPVARIRGVQPSVIRGFSCRLMSDASIQCVYVDRALHDRALSLLEQRVDKHWSLCDAVRFSLMQERGIHEALTTNHHFEQAGFVRLLK